MLSASHFLPRGRSKSSKEDSEDKRSASQDCARMPTSATNLFSFLSATVKSKYNRFDDFDGDADEDTIDDESLDDIIDEEQAVGTQDLEAFPEPSSSQKTKKTTKADLSSSEKVSKVTSLFRHLEMTDSQQDLTQQQETEQSPPESQSQLKSSAHSVVGAPVERVRSKSVSGSLDILTKVDSKAQDERASALAKKLKTRLGLDDSDTVIGEYPCWLLKNILLQGHMYLTNKHVCFFAYLPRKKQVVIRSGSLSKKSKHTPKYSRFWFVLRNDSLSYYLSSSELYFPSGTIDLRYAVKAEVTPASNGDKSESTSFTILTETRTYYFKADSHSAADEWVRSIQREIFRSRNEGDTVKIVIPTENIIDLEERPVFEIGQTLKIRAIDGDGSFAIDEYVLAFFKMGQEAMDAIRESMVQIGLPLGDEYDVKVTQRSVTESVIDTTGNSETSTSDNNNNNSTSPKLPAPFGPISRVSTMTTNRIRSLSNLSISPFNDKVKTISPKGSIRGLTNLLRKNDDPNNNLDEGDQIELEHDDDNDRYDILSASDSKDSSGNSPKSPARTQSEAANVRKSRKHAYSLSVVDKVSEMWEGGMKHFKGEGEPREDPHLVAQEDEQESNSRFRSHFSLTEDDSLVATYYAHIQKAFPVYGKMYLSNHHLCFRSLIPGVRTKMILPLRDIENVTKEKGFRFGYSGLVVIIHGHEEVFFEFGSGNTRDDCEMMILRQKDESKGTSTMESSMTSSDGQGSHGATSSYMMDRARLLAYEDLVKSENPGLDMPPPMVSDEAIQRLGKKPRKLVHFTMLTIGSRGDVQPYIALSKGLQKEGHKCRIATHIEFKDWIEEHGIEFREVAGDPGELMKIMVEHGMFSVTFIREASARFRTWIDELLTTSWEACQGTDVLIESPSAMAGIHIAEALNIPYFRAFTMPWTRTRAYPHAFIVPEQKMGGSYNYLTYVLFDNVFWKGIASQVNKWRKATLGLPRTNLDLMQQTKVPFLYMVSPSIFVPPVDFSDWVRVTGYWFLEEGNKDDYKPPKELADFIAKARKDKAKLVYIGFGSIVVSDSKELTKAVVKSVQKAGVRCVLSKGWSDRFDDKDASVPEVELPESIHLIKSAPHDWLFPQMDAAVHHGGSGTTGASLRAGLPTIIKPFFGDQFFYAGRVEDLGAGINLKRMTVSLFSKALWEATHNERIISKAASIGKHIRNEDGVNTAIMILYRYMGYATNLIRVKVANNEKRNKQNSGDQANVAPEDVTEFTDGSWTVLDTATKENDEK